MKDTITTKDLQDIDQAMEERTTKGIYEALRQSIGKLGKISYINEYGYRNKWVGYILEVNGNSILWQDNETPATFRISNIESFEVIEL